MRYKARSVAQAIDAVVWNGVNFTEVQVICPQATIAGTIISIPTAVEVYVGEVIVKDLSTGQFSKMKPEFLSAFYEGQIL